MKIKIDVAIEGRIGTAWCDIPDEHHGLPASELIERYAGPSFVAALERVNPVAVAPPDSAPRPARSVRWR